MIDSNMSFVPNNTSMLGAGYNLSDLLTAPIKGAFSTGINRKK
jgi:hypothetical protein